ncbi:MAG: DUF4340 domain-containing protein [Myxococcota bacterium]
MEERQSRLLTIMAGMLLLLVAVIVLIPEPDSDDGTGSGDFTDFLPDLQENDIVAVSLNHITLERAADPNGPSWRITAPGPLNADDDAVNELLNAIAELQCGDDLNVDDERRQEFGLNPPMVKVNVKTNTGESHEINLGRISPINQRTFLECLGAVRPSRRVLPTALSAPTLDALRSRDLFLPQDLAQVKHIEMQPHDQVAPFSIFRTKNNTWRFEDGSLANGTAVRSLIRTLRTARAEQFLDEHEIMAAISISVDGKTMDISADRIADAPAQDKTVKISEEVWLAVTRVQADWLSNRLIEDDPSRITSISVNMDGKKWHATRTEEGWSDKNAENLIQVLVSAQVDRKDVPDIEPGPEWGSITINEEPLTLYNRTNDRSGRMARNGDSPLFVIPVEQVAEILNAVAAQ